ncbi:cupin domain-containing protein [Streptomyces sp. HNM0663]|uniref:Cupin domain-containing protein n=1 Tax=Streptomyces chengmaiensis TaxID=3040919 RepID=A0ABT6HYR6_9ACTN|nr:cupin domain-containing protein [Streptomyces chengmaiensis]MDH2393861.1 cupin domain-containing protein [Streptomyces chengmaiensis]
MATIVRGERSPFGPIINDTSGLATTHRQVGGEGVCRWKMLMNGMHLEGEWNCVEYVVLTPGASVGEHVHMRTEEIYYIVRGQAVVAMNDVELHAGPGDLITTPIGAAHSIANRTDEEMHFFVIEVFPGEGRAAEPARLNVPAILPDADGVRRATVDLRPYFTGDWHSFALLDLPGGDTVTEEAQAGHAQVLHLLHGSAEFEVNGGRHEGGPGLSLAIPPRTSWTVRSAGPVSLISTRVAVR